MTEIKPGAKFYLTYIPVKIELLRIISRENGKLLPEKKFEWLDLNTQQRFINKEQDIKTALKFNHWKPLTEEDEEEL